jgi:hypothetical protein
VADNGDVIWIWSRKRWLDEIASHRKEMMPAPYGFSETSGLNSKNVRRDEPFARLNLYIRAAI